MSYRVLLSKSALKELDSLPVGVADRVNERLLQLKENPRPHDCKKLHNKEGWRIRVGDYRVIYQIRDNLLIVFVIRIRHRRHAYL
jgi:mRNA interferase RelE/StbE